MLASQIPTKIPLAFASSGSRNTIPVPSQVAITPGAASLADGFPPLTRTPIAAGGIAPAGEDMNGILYLVSGAAVWFGAGGPIQYDAAFSAAIGGYPRGCVLQSATFGNAWISAVDNNTTNPDAGGAGWASYVPGGPYVQQGGGTRQGTNKIYMGWGTDGSGLRVQVDQTDLGDFQPQSYIDQRDQSILAAAVAAAEAYANGSYDTASKVCPGGYIIKNGIATTNGGIQDFIAFPTAFPTACMAVVCVEDNAQPSWGHNASPTIYGVTARQAGGFYISCEVFVSGGFVPGPGQGFNYIAVGY